MGGPVLRTEDLQIPEEVRISKNIRIGWVRRTEIQISYWHGGQQLVTGQTFTWHDDSIQEEAISVAKGLCAKFGISEESSLSLQAFYSQSEVLRVQTAESSWSIPPSRRFMPADVLQCARRVWSSRSPKNKKPPAVTQYRAVFNLNMPVTGEVEDDFALDGLVSVYLEQPDQALLAAGLSIEDGRIQELKPALSYTIAGDLEAIMTGYILIGLEGRKATAAENANDLVNQLELSCSLLSPDISWDFGRSRKKRLAWTIVPMISA
ncbi:MULTISPECIES: hypothetical protein [Herbaspirillum]|uniref:Uncharacterized protein n=2 Tax=Herbaspirillum huttiense TaxID=863372 RepID=A0AAJ2H971_9BURK|nr:MULTISPECIES: hypothetical protein [Herbaspirillum]MDR9836819.1 hypothetical protein [Herbaspirillum huttiense]